MEDGIDISNSDIVVTDNINSSEASLISDFTTNEITVTTLTDDHLNISGTNAYQISNFLTQKFLFKIL